MTFSDQQIRRLKAKLDGRRIKSRQHQGRQLSYVEGWYVMAEANRIFGFDGWDRLSLSHQLLYERREVGRFQVSYLARVRVIVRAGLHSIVREGSGFGSASNADAGEAHELALKGAETDATKRALATFGNRFGLSLYEKDPTVSRKTEVAAERAQTPDGREASSPRPPLPLPSSPSPSAPTADPVRTGADQAENAAPERDPKDIQSALIFLKATRERLGRAASIGELDAVMERAADGLDRVRASHPDLRNRRGIHLVEVVQSIASLRRQEFERHTTPSAAHARLGPLRVAIDKSRLALATAKRHRNKDHLKRVAALPCLVCGRTPSQAHHVRFAQDRGLGLKVSDEFTVPLCAIDHDALHRSGDERRWWQEKNIDPLHHAARLWARSRGIPGGASDQSATKEGNAFDPHH